MLCVVEFELYIKWYIIIWSVGDRDLVGGGDSSLFFLNDFVDYGVGE